MMWRGGREVVLENTDVEDVSRWRRECGGIIDQRCSLRQLLILREDEEELARCAVRHQKVEEQPASRTPV